MSARDCIWCDLPADGSGVFCAHHATQPRKRHEPLAYLHTRAVDSGVVPMLLSLFEHALDEADVSFLPARPAWQRARALDRARVLRDLLAALGDRSACTVAREERLARLETGAEP